MCTVHCTGSQAFSSREKAWLREAKASCARRNLTYVSRVALCSVRNVFSLYSTFIKGTPGDIGDLGVVSAIRDNMVRESDLYFCNTLIINFDDVLRVLLVRMKPMIQKHKTVRGSESFDEE